MYENYGRRLKQGSKARVLAKPYRPIPCMKELVLRPSQELVGQVVEVVDKVRYHVSHLPPEVNVRDTRGQVHTVDVNYLRIV